MVEINPKFIKPEEEQQITESGQRLQGAEFATTQSQYLANNPALKQQIMTRFKERSTVLPAGEESLKAVQSTINDRAGAIKRAAELLTKQFGTSVVSPQALGAVVGRGETLAARRGQEIQDLLSEEADRVKTQFTNLYEVPYQRAVQANLITEQFAKEDYDRLTNSIAAITKEREQAFKDAQARAKQGPPFNPTEFMSDAILAVEKLREIDARLGAKELTDTQANIYKMLVTKNVQDAYKKNLRSSQVNEALGIDEGIVDKFLRTVREVTGVELQAIDTGG